MVLWIVTNNTERAKESGKCHQTAERREGELRSRQGD